MTERIPSEPKTGLSRPESRENDTGHSPATFGDVLARLRTSRRMTQWRLAQLAGCDHSTISRYQDGSRHPTRETVAALADALDCTAAERDELLRAAGFAVAVPDDVQRFASLPVETRRVLLEIAGLMGRAA